MRDDELAWQVEALADAVMVNAAVNALSWAGQNEALTPEKVAEFVLEAKREIANPRRFDPRQRRAR